MILGGYYGAREGQCRSKPVGCSFATGSMQIVALKGEQGAKGRVVKAEVVRHFVFGETAGGGWAVICGGTSSAPASTGTSAGTSQTDLWIASLSKRGCLRIHTIPSHQDDIAQTCSWQIDSEGVATTPHHRLTRH